MATLKDYVKLIDHLTEFTQIEQIHWKRTNPPNNIITINNRINQVYTTTYNHRHIRVYEEDYKYFTDEDVYYWQNQLIIELIDSCQNSIWQLPPTNNGWDLLNAIKYRDGNIDGFINDVLGY